MELPTLGKEHVQKGREHFIRLAIFFAPIIVALILASIKTPNSHGTISPKTSPELEGKGGSVALDTGLPAEAPGSHDISPPNNENGVCVGFPPAAYETAYSFLQALSMMLDPNHASQLFTEYRGDEYTFLMERGGILLPGEYVYSDFQDPDANGPAAPAQVVQPGDRFCAVSK